MKEPGVCLAVKGSDEAGWSEPERRPATRPFQRKGIERL